MTEDVHCTTGCCCIPDAEHLPECKPLFPEDDDPKSLYTAVRTRYASVDTEAPRVEEIAAEEAGSVEVPDMA